MPPITGRVLEQTVFDMHVRTVIDRERGVTRILHVHVGNGHLTVLEDEDASTASRNIQRAQADVGATVPDANVG